MSVSTWCQKLNDSAPSTTARATTTTKTPKVKKGRGGRKKKELAQQKENRKRMHQQGANQGRIISERVIFKDMASK